ncbi:LeuA family protein [Natronobeatus ordinarius]|uniref:LeuA family protein n=1 Tax=Natronobeatus ordinarius TaxID=2963433 RepID=UPI0020CC8D17|nr:citramalate synthase [Natronobeatus ordinarius]
MQLTDVTLREGEQRPGQSYAPDAKVEAGRRLDELGVASVQAGFPITGAADRQVVRTLADDLEADVVALARAVPGDVEAAVAAEADVVEVFAPLSDRQLTHLVDRSRAEMFDALREAVDLAFDHDAAVVVSLLDAFRTDGDHLLEAAERFPDVDVLNLADTVGARTPTSVATTLAELGERVDLGRLGVHFHDDLGVATANVLTAYEAGVGRADVSVASVGERAGNAALEEVVAAGVLEHGTSFGVDPERLVPVCEGVLETLGESVAPGKAVLGEEVTRHESGIHTAAMLADPSVFEPFDPATFGGERELVFGAASGRGAARGLLERAGLEPTDERVATVLELLEKRGPLDTAAAVELVRDRFGAD